MGDDLMVDVINVDKVKFKIFNGIKDFFKVF